MSADILLTYFLDVCNINTLKLRRYLSQYVIFLGFYAKRITLDDLDFLLVQFLCCRQIFWLGARFDCAHKELYKVPASENGVTNLD